MRNRNTQIGVILREVLNRSLLLKKAGNHTKSIDEYTNFSEKPCGPLRPKSLTLTGVFGRFSSDGRTEPPESGLYAGRTHTSTGPTARVDNVDRTRAKRPEHVLRHLIYTDGTDLVPSKVPRAETPSKTTCPLKTRLDEKESSRARLEQKHARFLDKRNYSLIN